MLRQIQSSNWWGFHLAPSRLPICLVVRRYLGSEEVRRRREQHVTAAAVLAEKLEASRQELRHAVAAIGPRPGPEVRACLEDQERAIRRIKVGIDKH